MKNSRTTMHGSGESHRCGLFMLFEIVCQRAPFLASQHLESQNSWPDVGKKLHLGVAGKFHGWGGRCHPQAAQSSTFKDALLGTGDKTLVYLDADPWAGMMAPGGIGGIGVRLGNFATGWHMMI